jgi:hypothetical protein
MALSKVRRGTIAGALAAAATLGGLGLTHASAASKTARPSVSTSRSASTPTTHHCPNGGEIREGDHAGSGDRRSLEPVG